MLRFLGFRQAISFIHDKTATIVVLIMLLSGCTSMRPAQLGYKQAEWDQMSLGERYQVHYQAASLSQQHDEYWKKLRNQSSANKKPPVVVTLGPGQAFLSPAEQWLPFLPLTITLYDGQCKSVTLHGQAQATEVAVTEVCYAGDVIGLDPSKRDKAMANASVWIYRSPLWFYEGFNYHPIRSTGQVQLRDASIKVVTVDPLLSAAS